jgi:hypothetical protein
MSTSARSSLDTSSSSSLLRLPALLLKLLFDTLDDVEELFFDDDFFPLASLSLLLLSLLLFDLLFDELLESDWEKFSKVSALVHSLCKATEETTLMYTPLTTSFWACRPPR